jgi:hypothetical protein
LKGNITYVKTVRIRSSWSGEEPLQTRYAFWQDLSQSRHFLWQARCHLSGLHRAFSCRLSVTFQFPAHTMRFPQSMQGITYG